MLLSLSQRLSNRLRSMPNLNPARIVVTSFAVIILTGTLLEIGSGQRRPEEMKEILEGKNRALAGRTAPAQGLMLVAVRYGDEYEV